MKPRAKAMKLDKAIDLLLDQSFSSDEEELEDSDQSSVSETQNDTTDESSDDDIPLCKLAGQNTETKIIFDDDDDDDSDDDDIPFSKKVAKKPLGQLDINSLNMTNNMKNSRIQKEKSPQPNKLKAPKSILKGIFGFLEREDFWYETENRSDTSSISDLNNSFECDDFYENKDKRRKQSKRLVSESPAIKMQISDKKQNRFCLSIKNLKRKKIF